LREAEVFARLRLTSGKAGDGMRVAGQVRWCTFRVCYVGIMNWTDILSGAVGGFVGSAIPGWLAWLGLRREGKKQREDRWRGEDAPVVADAVGLLLDVDPDRRMASISPVPATEQATWDDILRRRAGVGGKLLAMAAGHPSAPIRDCAQNLEAQVAASVIQTQWLVTDQIGHRDVPGQYDTARKCHETATATAKNLQGLAIAFGLGGRQK
jgi:hypothetical protein